MSELPLPKIGDVFGDPVDTRLADAEAVIVRLNDKLADEVAKVRSLEQQLKECYEASCAEGPDRPRDIEGDEWEHMKAKLVALTQQRDEQKAWLVERQGSGGPAWWTGRGNEFTTFVDGPRNHPSACAMRFARREDAERAIGWLLSEDLASGCKAAEHLWL